MIIDVHNWKSYYSFINYFYQKREKFEWIFEICIIVTKEIIKFLWLPILIMIKPIIIDAHSLLYNIIYAYHKKNENIHKSEAQKTQTDKLTLTYIERLHLIYLIILFKNKNSNFNIIKRLTCTYLRF